MSRTWVTTNDDIFQYIKGGDRVFIEFGYGSVPISIAARVYGKDQSWIRAGIIAGWLPIGVATRDGKLVTKYTGEGRINYYISPKKLYEETGYVYKGGYCSGNKNTTRNEQKEQVSH